MMEHDRKMDAEDNFLEKVTENPLVQFLAEIGVGSLLPIPGAGILMLKTISWISKKSGKLFVKEIKSASDRLGVEVTSEDLEDGDFVAIFMRALEFAARERAEDKIRLFALLCIQGKIDPGYRKSEEPYEFMQIISDMSLEERRLLQLLEKHEDLLAKNLVLSRDSVSSCHQQWQLYLDEASREINCDKGMVHAKLSRLQRTGCIMFHHSTFALSNSMHGSTTPLYRKMIRRINYEGL
jgi:hypothetical protein